jgi:hypothetical protein
MSNETIKKNQKKMKLSDTLYDNTFLVFRHSFHTFQLYKNKKKHDQTTTTNMNNSFLLFC